jgi:hypothetical protein
MKRLVKKAEQEIRWSDIPRTERNEIYYRAEEDVDDFLNSDFQDYAKQEVEKTFPNSDLKFFYDFSYSQGDGFGLNGKISNDDVLNITQVKLSPDDLEIFDYEGEYYIRNERWSPFYTDGMLEDELSYWNEEDINYYLEDSFEEDKIKSFDVKGFIEKIETIHNKLDEFLDDFCARMKKEGYEYFDYEEDYVVDYLTANEWTYTDAETGEEYTIIK